MEKGTLIRVIPTRFDRWSGRPFAIRVTGDDVWNRRGTEERAEEAFVLMQKDAGAGAKGPEVTGLLRIRPGGRSVFYRLWGRARFGVRGQAVAVFGREKGGRGSADVPLRWTGLAFVLAAAALADLAPLRRVEAVVSRSALQAVVRRHKYAWMAFSPAAQKALGAIAAGRSGAGNGGRRCGSDGAEENASAEAPSDPTAPFWSIAALALAEPPTVGRWRNVLQHMIGYVTRLRPETRADWQRRIEGSLADDVPADVLFPLREAAEASGLNYLTGQSVLDPVLLRVGLDVGKIVAAEGPSVNPG
ncbi:MAG: YbgA family protein [Hydrogenibacillus schlegelii]|uniref:YbgA family protein n=1 Tax=Hydrogenibacillus schlegelii TaxID=1484 RepID=A0A947CXM5_HYDSH|nr:YbgA family protein [Hydrogenibacillus schlegelii]